MARVKAERVRRGYIYSSASKEPLGEGVPGDSGYMSGDSGTLGFQTLNRARTLRATGSGVSGPIPGVSGYGRGKIPVFAPLSCFVAHKCLSRFS